MRTAINRSGTVQTVLKRLRKEILTGKISDGSMIKEIEFSEKYGCSRAALRGALAVLEQEGLINVNPNGTKYISSLSERDIDNLYELRQFVELSAARELLKSELFELLPLLNVLESSKNDLSEAFRDSDLAFHGTLVSLSKNKALIGTWNIFMPLMQELISLNLLESEGHFGAFCERHQKIAKLLAMGDEEAVRLLSEHIEEARLLTVKIFSKYKNVEE